MRTLDTAEMNSLFSHTAAEMTASARQGRCMSTTRRWSPKTWYCLVVGHRIHVGTTDCSFIVSLRSFPTLNASRSSNFCGHRKRGTRAETSSPLPSRACLLKAPINADNSECGKPRAEANTHGKPAPDRVHHPFFKYWHCCSYSTALLLLSACLSPSANGEVCKGGNCFVYSSTRGAKQLDIKCKIHTGKTDVKWYYFYLTETNQCQSLSSVCLGKRVVEGRYS